MLWWFLPYIDMNQPASAFELWCCRRLLRVPWTARRSNQLILKEISPEYSNQSWIFIGRTDAEAETAVLWPPDVKNWLTGKDSDAGKEWRQEEKGTTEDEMVGWHHQLDGHEFEQAPGVGDGQGSLVCCSSWSQKELDTIERLNWIHAPTQMKLENIMLRLKYTRHKKTNLHNSTYMRFLEFLE